MRHKAHFAVYVTVLCTWLFANAQSPEPGATIPLQLGKPFAALELLTKDSRPAQAPATGMALLVHLPVKSCRDLAGSYEEYRKAASPLKVAVVPIIGIDPRELDAKCRTEIESIPTLFTATRSAAARFAGNGFLVENGIVRRILHSLTAARIVNEVALWQGGRQIYDAQCARCHGLDGTDNNYPNIKSLAGIGNRASESKIIEMTELTGAVDLHALSAKDRQALAAYVAGL